MKILPKKPVIGISMGDPLGIGPEILVKAFQEPALFTLCRPLVIGDPFVMQKACDLFGASLGIHETSHPDRGRYEPGILDLMPVSNISTDLSGLSSPTPEIGKAMEAYILNGVTLAMGRSIAALVTCPITKTGLKRAGSRFHGHTELIANKTQTSRFSMMMAGSRLKVVLVTIHIPLSQVPEQISTGSILDTLRLTHTSLADRFGIASPRLAVAGLNPHAGEEGLFGAEETDIIEPAVRAARREGMDVTGPLPPDTVFFQAVNNKFDAVVSMYHDQGLIPFKLVHFRDGVNTTLGLPIIRTSVDHGTAYDIAWQGLADPSSLTAAIHMAVLQAGNRTDLP